MANENFLRRYVMTCGKMGQSGFEIGNIHNATEDVLHVSFSVEKSNAESPNTAKVQVWNLSDRNLRVLDTKDCILELKAGYADTMALILVGNITTVTTVPDKADRMTEIEVMDGRVELRDTNISVSLNGTVNCKDVYKLIAGQMGVSVVFANDLSFKTLPNGYSYVGKAKNALQKMANACGHSWTIQNKVLQITWPGRAVNTMGYLLDSSSGLIGRPKRITISTGMDSKEAQTGWEVQYFLNGAIGVNDIVKLQSEDASGFFLVHKITIDGDNMEGDWLCTAQLLQIMAQPKLDKKTSSGGSAAGSSGSSGSSGGSAAVTFKKGDKVKVIRTIQQGKKTKGYKYAGGTFVCYYPVYDVIQAKGDRIVIGIGSTVTAAVNAKDLAKA